MQSDILSASILDDFYEENEPRSPSSPRRPSQPSSPSRGGFLSSFTFLRDGFTNSVGSGKSGQSLPTSPRRYHNSIVKGNEYDSASESRSYRSAASTPLQLPSQSAFAFIGSGNGSADFSNGSASKSNSKDSLFKSGTRQMRQSQFSFIEADLVATPSNELAFAIDSPTAIQPRKKSSLPMPPPSASIVTSDPPVASPIIVRQQDYERQKVSSESSLKRIQTETNRHISSLSAIFENQGKAYRQLEQLYNTLRSLELKEDDCLQEEDFVRADAVHADWEKTSKQIHYTETEKLKELNKDFDKSWSSLSKLMRQESDAAAKAAEACVVVKEARERSLEQYVTDTNNLQRQKMKEIMDLRALIDKEKSENAFDYEMWEKAESEYLEKVDDLVHEEKKDRDSWYNHQQEIESEIEELLRKVNALKQSRDECVEKIKQLDATIDRAIAVHGPEKETLNYELELVVKRKADIDARSAQIDEQEGKLQRMQEKHDKDTRRQESEIEALGQKIGESRDRANIGQEDADEIDRIMRNLVSDFEKLVEPKVADLASHQRQSDEQRSKVDRLSAQLVTTKSKLQRLSKDIMIVEAQLPDLEEQKSMAVGGRDFKMAAKMSSKIKNLKGALEQSVLQKEELQQTVAKADLELKDARQTLQNMVRQRKEAERTTGEDVLQAIQQCRQNLIIARER
ncbi:unnamed protein product [Umbelopsis ramanniana]